MGLGDNIVLLSTNVDLGRDKIFNKIKKVWMWTLDLKLISITSCKKLNRTKNCRKKNSTQLKKSYHILIIQCSDFYMHFYNKQKIFTLDSIQHNWKLEKINISMRVINK